MSFSLNGYVKKKLDKVNLARKKSQREWTCLS